MIKEVIISLVIVIIICTLVHILYFRNRQKQMIKNLKIGDPVYFYVDEDEKVAGLVTAITPMYTVVTSRSGKVKLLEDSIFPVMDYKYKK